jgi:hypothetical protein
LLRLLKEAVGCADLISRKLALDFHSQMYMGEDEIARLRASYTYHQDMEHRFTSKCPRFSWHMMMWELDAIKAQALGPVKVVTVEYYKHFVLKHTRLQ